MTLGLSIYEINVIFASFERRSNLLKGDPIYGYWIEDRGEFWGVPMDMNPQDVMLSDTVTGKRKGNRDIPTCQEGKGIKYTPPHAHPSKNRMKQKQYRITFNDKNR